MARKTNKKNNAKRNSKMAKKADNKAKVSKDEQIGIHKGALSTLAKERAELARLLSVVEQLMKMHISALKELGVDLEKVAKEAQKQAGTAKGKKGSGKIEDMI